MKALIAVPFSEVLQSIFRWVSGKDVVVLGGMVEIKMSDSAFWLRESNEVFPPVISHLLTKTLCHWYVHF